MITCLNLGYNGRFGNQIFQFAALIGISDKLGYDVMIPYNNLVTEKIQTTMDGKSFSARFELNDCFDIDKSYFNNSILVNSIKNESHFHFDESMFMISDFTNINGYFQTDRYFSHCEDKIQDILKFKIDILSDAKSKLPKTKKKLVSVHVRRGDYTTPNQYHPVMGIDYFNRAVEYFKDDKYQFVIFSDDKEWCLSNFNKDFIIFESDSHMIDFCAMSLCDHNIISNSSFSWWASYLNRNNDKKVIAPSNWFGSGFSHYKIDDLYTKNMIII